MYDLCSPTVGTAEALDIARIRGLGLLELGGILDISKCCFDIRRSVGSVFFQSRQGVDGLFRFASPDSIPGRFGSVVGGEHERQGPDPLQTERQFPAEFAFDDDHGPYDAGGEQDTGAPAHADVSCKVRPENRRDDFRSVGRRECLSKQSSEREQMTHLPRSGRQLIDCSPGRCPTRHHT